MVIRHHFRQYGWLWLVFSTGILLRVWAVWQTAIINPDGALYIYQAKAIHAGHWKQLTTCGITYISVYPFLVAASYAVVGNWIVAPQIVSMLFSSATLIPIYLTCRRLFDTSIAALATLIVAMNPVMCSRSGDVVRDPVYWFFLSLGIYWVVRYWDERSRFGYLFFSTIAFVLATWARIEAILLIGVSGIFISLLGASGRLKRVTAFALPLFVLGSGVLVCMAVLDIPMDRLLRLDEISKRATHFIDSYHLVSSYIETVAATDIPSTVRYFLPEAENHIWLIALGTVLNRTLESFFYPFVPFFLIGLWHFRLVKGSDSRWWYVLLAFVSGYLLLYLHLINVWVLEYRFLMLVYIPGILFAAAGLHRSVEQIERRWRWGKNRIVWVTALLLLLAGLPKNLQPRDPDKIVFVEVAARIAERQGPEEPALISSSIHTHRWISLYANINHSEPPCPESNFNGLWDRFSDNADEIAADLKARNISFFLYEERHWPIKNFDPEGFFKNQHFKRIGDWYHQDTGRMLLYQLR
jgi:4-amino-4-deoxy-L-arabinose transferase-like glycosyltransferase